MCRSSQYVVSEKPMNRLVTVLAMAGLLLVGAQALAVDTDQPALTKRQMLTQVIGCMKKRMAASRTMSYNEAAKVCKDQLHQSDSSSPPLVAADTPAKP
jgi:hypothetical protein